MSMIGELHAEETAKKLEKIILNAMSSDAWIIDRKNIRKFVKEHLIEWYYDECGDTWGAYSEHPDIVKAFPPKK